MSKGEWSGWVQAVGAVAALAIAIGLATYQTWHAAKALRLQQREAERRQVAHVHHIVLGVVQGAVKYAFSHLRAALRPGDKFSMRVERLEDAFGILNQAILMPLPPDASRVLFNVNSLLSNLLHVAEDAAKPGINGSDDARHAIDAAEAMWARVGEDLKKLASTYELVAQEPPARP